MEGQRDAVRGDPHVGLEVAVAELDGALEGAQRVLVTVRREPAMGEGDRAWAVQERHSRSAQHERAQMAHRR